MSDTRDGIMAQIWVAFGQGTGAVRISQEAALELHRSYYYAITPHEQESWGDKGFQVLDRVRAIGRLAAAKAASAGASAITLGEVQESASALLKTEGTDLFPVDEFDRNVRLRAALASAPATTEISNLELLDDSALWNAAQTRMPQPDSERMEELHRKNRATGLSEVEAEELARLERQYERVILVRSHSTSLLEKRGHDIRGLVHTLTPPQGRVQVTRGLTHGPTPGE